MRRLKNLLFSMELTGILILLFAISIGFATFIENDFGTVAAKAKVYNALWFEIMLSLLVVNMIGSIIKYKMYLKHKWTIFLFHISFLVIFAGAAVTRYVGYEGIMTIREGQSSNKFQSDETYVIFKAKNKNEQAVLEKKVVASPIFMNDLEMSQDLDSMDVELTIKEYYTNAAETYEEDDNGEPVIWLVVSTKNRGRRNLYVKQGDLINVGDIQIAFEKPLSNDGMGFHLINGQLMMSATDSVLQNNMVAKIKKNLAPDSTYLFPPLILHSMKGVSVVMKQFFPKAITRTVSTDGKEGMSTMDAFLADVSVDGQSKEILVYGGKGFMGIEKAFEINGVNVTVNFGSKTIFLPFSIRLDDFQMERYPGTNSASSYASDVTVIDEGKNLVMPYRIFMNNVLNYGGYRFFQSSFDRDEKGTVLSVNHDAAGTIVTYLGYLLMTLGMVFSVFNKSSRFITLFRFSGNLRKKRKEVLTLFLAIGMTFGSYSASADETNNSQIPEIKKEHTQKFGELLIQDNNGRIKPINTIASEVLRKIARKTSFEGMSPEQIFLGIMVYPETWQNVDIIKVAHPQLQDFLGIEGKYCSFSDIVDLSTGKYKISDYVERAYAKKPAEQSKFDKEVMKVDERINIFYMIYSGTFLTVFPVPDHANDKWITSADAEMISGADESLFVSGIFSMYFQEVIKANKSGNWETADEHLGYIKQYQKQNGSNVVPSDKKVKMEVTYNKINIFKRLSMYYGLIGFILIVLHFINILKPGINLKWVIRISSGLVVILFLMHTFGLILRWNISGEAPWSNGYESMIFIAWATILAGLIFVWRSEITLAVTALLASLILAVAGMNWMDPEITPLVPVLKSYWLIVHVAIITASYGFLALGALLGFFNLLLMNLKTKKNFKYLDLTVTEMNYVIEMTLIVGLFMLTIGTFLGGVWANESWGRYWGWDPKETWALVTVLVYSFVLHMRFIPGLRGNFTMSFASLISFGSVLMTYFGVNYYLSGLHSYAAGDPVPVPTFVYYTLIVIFVAGIMAYFSERKYLKLSK